MNLICANAQNQQEMEAFERFTTLTINMLNSYSPYIGTITIQQMNTSGGVITAATMAITITAFRVIQSKN